MVLLGGVLAVITDLGSSSLSRKLAFGDMSADASDPGSLAVDGWTRLLREDLDNAVAVPQVKESELIIVGYSALDNQRRERTHRPVLVRYKIEVVDGRPWLVRRQALLDVLTNQNVQRDLVCAGVLRFQVEHSGPLLEQWGVGHMPVRIVARGQRKSGGPSGTSVASRREEAARRRGLDRDKSYLHGGLMYYPEYLPPWARTEIEDKLNRDNDSAARSGDRRQIGATDAPPPSGTTAAEGILLEGVHWRLKVWTDQGEDPTYERTITISQ
jgi:hypothetical protein